MFLRGLRRKIMFKVIGELKNDNNSAIFHENGVDVADYIVDTESAMRVKIKKGNYFAQLNFIQSLILRRYIHKLHANKMLGK